MRLCSIFAASCHLVFYGVWSLWLPQPYENLQLRLAAASLNLLILLPPVATDPKSPASAWIFNLVFWLQLPFFFTWMFLSNGGNAVWLSSFCAMMLIYYHLADWRLASLGLCTGVLAAGSVFAWGHPQGISAMIENRASALAVLVFCALTALILGLSSANLKQTQTDQALVTMGILAHELRTPLATLNLVGNAMQAVAAAMAGGPAALEIEALSLRLQRLVRQMNHQIDSQISNARLLHLPVRCDLIQVRPWLTQMLQDYPYRSSAEQACISLEIHDDFCFLGSRALMTQVLDNLLCNAWHSLAAIPQSLQHGDIRLLAYCAHGKGHLVVSDRGLGIDEHLKNRIFQPFFSTSQENGHGLGLAFCQRVMASCAGHIAVQSELGQGAHFILTIPLQPCPVEA